MSYYVMEPRHSSRVVSRVGIGLAAALVLLAGIAIWASLRPYIVFVDGATAVVPAESTVGDLSRLGLIRSKSGDLVGVNGSVLRKGGGAAPRVVRNGAPARASQRVYPEDRVTSSAGRDLRERLESVETTIPYTSRVAGRGPVAELTQEGRDGVMRITRGAVSGIEVTRTVVREPVAEVLTRYSARPGAKLVALTFDDGPWDGQTQRILKVLARERVHATFFMLGGQVKKHPELARQVADAGHLVGSHSLGHRVFSEISPAQIRREVKGGRGAIERATGQLTPWIRPPYGAMDAQAWRVLRSMKMHAVMWDVDSGDWRKPGVKTIVRTVVKNVRPGSIVLFHDGGGDRRQTAAALPAIIRQLKAKGYVFATVEELVESDGVKKEPAAKIAETGTPNR